MLLRLQFRLTSKDVEIIRRGDGQLIAGEEPRHYTLMGRQRQLR
jgi:hypothetical protein